ncbi:MAG: septum formation family protein [Nitriliruptorales bacterium]|nr:septum formation family protein [Nitriliruptorales bacterium]
MIRVAPLIAAALVVSGCGLFGGNVFDLEVGTCFNDPDEPLTATEVDNVPIVDCDEPHDNEVYAAFDMADGEFPGAAAAEEQAFNDCLTRFEFFVGVSWDASELDFVYLYPTDVSWSQGDREIVCAVHRVDGARTTGTLENARI